MRCLLTAVFAAAMLGASVTSSAAPAIAGTIYVTDTYAPGTGAAIVDPNGGTPTPTCAGDPSHATPRLFVTAIDHALLWSDDSCLPRDLIRDQNLTVSFARWSPTENHVAFIAGPSTDPPTYERTIYVARVTRGNAELSVGDVTPVALLQYGGTRFSWTPDGGRLVFAYPNPAHKQSSADPDSSAPTDIYSVAIVDGSKQNLTGTPGTSEYDPAVAPDGQRLAFVRQTVTRGVARSDLFTMAVSGGNAVQVTNKSNTTATTRNSQPAWSPDGAHLAFACLASSIAASTHVCRIDALGRTKSVDLTPKATANFSVTAWRSS